MALQQLGIDHLTVACSRDEVGKKSSQDTPSPMVQAAAEKIHRLARDRGLTIEQLAKKAGRPFQTFNNWKKGHTTAKLESLEAFARVVDATVVLGVNAPGEGEGGLHVDNRDTFMIARLVDGMDDADREWWRKQIQDFVNWRRVNPPDPPAGLLPAPRGRSRT